MPHQELQHKPLLSCCCILKSIVLTKSTPRQDDCNQHTCGLDMHAVTLQHVQGGMAAVEAALDLHGKACWSEV